MIERDISTKSWFVPSLVDCFIVGLYPAFELNFSEYYMQSILCYISVKKTRPALSVSIRLDYQVELDVISNVIKLITLDITMPCTRAGESIWCI